MTFKAVLKSTEKFIVDNSPGILTGLAVAGTVTTAVLAGKAAYSSALILSNEEYHRRVDKDDNTPLPVKEKLELIWKEYIPAAIVLSTTVTSIIMANQIGSRRAAAIAAAFKLSEKMADEYREKVAEVIGKNKEEAVRTELAKDRMERTPGSDIIILTGPETLFFDEWSGRYFKSEMEKVRKAVNDINYQVNNDFYASLTDFYDLLGLPKTVVSDDFGWNTDQLLDVTYGAVQHDGRAAISINYNKTPIKGYDRCQ